VQCFHCKMHCKEGFYAAEYLFVVVFKGPNPDYTV